MNLGKFIKLRRSLIGDMMNKTDEVHQLDLFDSFTNFRYAYACLLHKNKHVQL